MTDHPITPPPELVRQWLLEYYGSDLGEMGPDEMYLARCGAQWGADQELKACRVLLQQLADIENAFSKNNTLVSAQGQAMDGFTALANFRSIAAKAIVYLSTRRALEQLDD